MIAAQDNTLRTKYIKAKVDYMNRICGDRYEKKKSHLVNSRNNNKLDGGECDHMGIMQETKISPYKQMEYAQTFQEFVFWNCKHLKFSKSLGYTLTI